MKIKLYITTTNLMQNNSLLILEDKEHIDFNIVMSKILSRLKLNDYTLVKKNSCTELLFDINYVNLVVDYLKLFCSYGDDIDKLNEINYYLEELNRDYRL